MSAGKYSYYPSSKKLLFTTNGDQNKKSQLSIKQLSMDCGEPNLSGTSVSQLQELYIRAYHGGGGKMLRVRISEF